MKTKLIPVIILTASSLTLSTAVMASDPVEKSWKGTKYVAGETWRGAKHVGSATMRGTEKVGDTAVKWTENAGKTVWYGTKSVFTGLENIFK